MPKRPPLDVTDVAPKAEPAGLKADETPKLKNGKGLTINYYCFFNSGKWQCTVINTSGELS